jgi:WASH complex subunit 7, N-terminal
MLSESWEDTFQTDVSSKSQIDAQIQKTLTFIQKHEEKLHDKHESLSLYCDAKTAFRSVRIAIDRTERVAVDNILQPDDTNETFRKILVVLVFLCDEIHELKDVAEEKFFPTLIMFGRSPVDDSAGKRNDRLIVAAKYKLLTCIKLILQCLKS